MKGLGNMQGIMKQMNQMQNRMKQVQESFAENKYEGSAGGGAVKVTVQGQDKIIDFKISSEIFSSEDKDMLQDLLVAATNDALARSKEAYNKEMEKVTGNSMPFSGLL